MQKAPEPDSTDSRPPADDPGVGPGDEATREPASENGPEPEAAVGADAADGADAPAEVDAGGEATETDATETTILEPAANPDAGPTSDPDATETTILQPAADAGAGSASDADVTETAILAPAVVADAYGDADTAILDPGAGAPTTVLEESHRHEAAPEMAAAPAADLTEKDPDRTRWWVIVLGLPVGAAGALLGLVPWLLTGGLLPLQNLWATDARPGTMPFVLLPFSQYYVIQVFSLLIVGAALAGIGGRALRMRGWALTLLELGVLAVQVFAIVQTTIVVRDGLQDRFESAMYLAGLAIGAVLSVLVGILVTQLVAAAPRAGAVLGLTAGAIGMTSWGGMLLFPAGVTGDPLADLAVILPWVAPVLTGLAIVWAGVNTVGRAISAVVALAMIWIAPAVTTALASTLGSRVLLGSGSEMIEYGQAVFESALLTPEVALRPVIAAAAVATVGLLIRLLVTMLVRRGAHSDAHADAETHETAE